MMCGTKRASSATRGLLVLVDVDDHVRRREFADASEVNVFGAADFRDAADRRARMDAETGAADERVSQAQVAYEFGNARHERHDARRRCHRGVARADGVDEFVRRMILPW